MILNVDYANSLEERKFTSRYYIFVGENLIILKRKKQIDQIEG